MLQSVFEDVMQLKCIPGINFEICRNFDCQTHYTNVKISPVNNNFWPDGLFQSDTFYSFQSSTVQASWTGGKRFYRNPDTCASSRDFQYQHRFATLELLIETVQDMDQGKGEA